MIINLIPIPVLLLLSVLQMTAISRINLLSGMADLVLLAVASQGVQGKGSSVYIWALLGGLFISLSTAMPFLSPAVPYLFTALIASLLHKRFWQSPILALIITMIAGTLFQHIFYILLLQFTGIEMGFAESIGNVTIPSLLLNFFFLLPVYVFIKDLGKWTTPEELYD